MAVRIGPSDTPYWLFSTIFLLLLSYFGLDLINLQEKARINYKYILFLLVVIGVVGGSFVSAIIVRHQTHPIYMIHDIILQQEAAIRFFLDGKNPYAVTYFGTPMEQWNYSPHEINPALYHFVMQPLYLLFVLPFYYIANHTIGFFDGRMPLLVLFLSTLITGFLLIKDKEKLTLFSILIIFNPAMYLYTLEGRSDMFMFGFLFFSLYLLHREKFTWSAVFMSFAFAIKQSVWPLAPFYFAYLYFKTKKPKKLALPLITFSVIFLVIVVPFIWWNPQAFLNSTVLYLSGNTEHSYPVSGYGFGKILQDIGYISDPKSYYPFHIWQLVVGVPLLVVGIRYLQKNPTVKRMITIYTLFLFVYWYFSRYFNNSHLGFLSVLFITAYFFPEDKK